MTTDRNARLLGWGVGIAVLLGINGLIPTDWDENNPVRLFAILAASVSGIAAHRGFKTQ